MTNIVAAVLLFLIGAPVPLPGTHGKFDFIKIDAVNRRLLACHTQNGSLDVIDLNSSRLIKSLVIGNAQGVAMDEKCLRYFVSCSKPPQLVIIDSAKLEVIRVVPLPEPADVLAYATSNDRVFVCNDTKPELWIIDPEAGTILATLMLPGAGMEDLGFNAAGSFLFQNLKSTSALAKIDATSLKIVDSWPTAPAEKPHGLAILTDRNVVLVAGGTGELVMMSLADGHVLASTAISQRVDEIAYDPGLRRVYCASGLGVISVVAVGNDSLKTLGSVPSSPGAHSIAVDPKTHTVWIAYAKGEQAFIQPFFAKP